MTMTLQQALAIAEASGGCSDVGQALKVLAAAVPKWQPIETAPKYRTLLLGYRNALGNWRTVRGRWFTQREIDEDWEDGANNFDAGWFETSVEAEDVPPNCWPIDPTSWQPLPAEPEVKR